MSRTRKDRKEAKAEARLKDDEWTIAANKRRNCRQQQGDICPVCSGRGWLRCIIPLSQPPRYTEKEDCPACQQGKLPR